MFVCFVNAVLKNQKTKYLLSWECDITNYARERSGMKKVALLLGSIFSIAPGYYLNAKKTSVTKQEKKQILHLIKYASGSNKTAYAANKFLAGYSTLNLGGEVFKGQRDPAERLKKIPYDFTGKTVLDIGSNQGGMLFALQDKIKYGIGLDYDYKLINIANRIRSSCQAKNIDFYVFDLEKDNLNLIPDFIKDQRVDVCFFLSVCAWIKNWRGVLDAIYKLSNTLVFESNGTAYEQEQQINYLKKKYASIRFLTKPGKRNAQPLDKSIAPRTFLICFKNNEKQAMGLE